jgi:hypothetical protein
VKRLPLKAIRTDGGTQPREAISNDVVARYRDDMARGATFPPVTVFYDGKECWLADGFHRYQAAAALDRKVIDCDVHRGTQRDAVIHSCGANATHGEPRSNADKRRAIERLLRDREWRKWSDSKIAEVCAVDHKTVADVRRSLRAILGTSQDAGKRLAERNGKVYVIDTGNIGGRPQPGAQDDMTADRRELHRRLALLAAAKLPPPPGVSLYMPDPPRPDWLTRTTAALGAARFTEKSHNGKLVPVTTDPGLARGHVVPLRPFAATTSVSIERTCPRTCVFKDNGCYAQGGSGNFSGPRLDAAAWTAYSSEDVIEDEVQQIDGAFGGGPVPQDGARGGRDLRLHVGGDVGSEGGAWRLSGAATRWRERGGGAVWTYTHLWRHVPREAWGKGLSVLASVERAADIEVARQAGYASAIVVEDFPRGGKAFSLPGTAAQVLPCPAETTLRTPCVSCRLCMDDRDLIRKNQAIAFKVHGEYQEKARKALREGRSTP